MPTTTRFADLDDDQLPAAALVLATLGTSLNIPTGTRVAAVAQTATGLYAGAQLQLTLPSAIHAEAAAISVAQSSGDLDIHTLYVASRRFDDRDAGNVTPCGNCCQLIHDVSVYTGIPITLISLNEHNGAVYVIQPGELLPHAFESKKLRRAGESRRLLPAPASADVR